MGSRRRYSREFKIEAVRMVTQLGHPVSEVARDLGVGRGMLTKWRKQLQEQGVTAFPGAGKMPDQDLDGQQLRRDLRRVRQERDILKKRWRSSRNARDEVPDHQATVRQVPGAAVVQDARGVSRRLLRVARKGAEPESARRSPSTCADQSCIPREPRPLRKSAHPQATSATRDPLLSQAGSSADAPGRTSSSPTPSVPGDNTAHTWAVSGAQRAGTALHGGCRGQRLGGRPDIPVDAGRMAIPGRADGSVLATDHRLGGERDDDGRFDAGGPGSVLGATPSRFRSAPSQRPRQPVQQRRLPRQAA